MTPLLARPRSDRAFERLYQRHVGDVYRYALAVLRNEADAEDVTQTTFLNAYRAFERGERPEVPHNWLIAIAHNVCRQRFRQSARRPQEVTFADDIADQVEDDESPTAEDIRRALGHLAFNQRAALVMRELEGRSYAEIGEILGLSVSAVETLIFRARRALREQLEGSLTCGEAEFAISKQLDGELSRTEKGQLRAHLRECPDCASFARRQRAQRAALKSLGAAPLPASLASFFSSGGGVAALGGGVAIKAAALVAAGAVASGVSYVAVRHVTTHETATPTRHARLHAARSAPGVAAVPVVLHHVAAAPTPAGPRLRVRHKALAHVHLAASGAHHGRSAAAKPAAHGQVVRAAHAEHVHVVGARGSGVRAHGAPARTHSRRGGQKRHHVVRDHASGRHAPKPHVSHSHGSGTGSGNTGGQSGRQSGDDISGPSGKPHSSPSVLPKVKVPAVTVTLPGTGK